MAKTLAGAKASLKLNGVKVAFVSSVNITSEYTLQDIEVLDNPLVEEFAEIGHKCNFSVNTFKVDENAAQVLGLESRNIDDLLSQPELTMEVYNRLGDVVVFEVTGVKFEGGTGTVDARSVWSGTWNFRGKRGFGL